MTTLNPLAQSACNAFELHFGCSPDVVVFAPGRMNLIGEHTDYNHGFVLPAAVSQGIYFALGLSPAHEWHALDIAESITLSADTKQKTGTGWADYFLGAYLQLADRISGSGLRCVFTSDLPAGAGLSSSSALTCGFLLGLNALCDDALTREELALSAHQVEREYIGLQGGIMDQYASLLCESGCFLLLDCHNRTFSQVLFPLPSPEIFLLNTNVQHKLTESDYNTRAAECRRALSILSDHAGITSLRQATMPMLYEFESALGELLLHRISFVIAENARVLEAVRSVNAQNWNRLGDLIRASHAGLRDEYQVSCAELDFLAEYIHAWPVYGARMMGGGFGGCTINLAQRLPDDGELLSLQQAYRGRFGKNCSLIRVAPAGGAWVFEYN